MTKEQLAESYALSKFPRAYEYDGRKTWESLCPLDRFEDAENAFIAGFEGAEPKWIKCSDKMPEPCKVEGGVIPNHDLLLLYWTKHGSYEFGVLELKNGELKWDMPDVGVFDLSEVSHWALPPKPPNND